jgi:hypothetical protein
MMAEWSPIRISDYKNETLDKNVLKFITTGIDDSAVITTPSSKVQKSVNSGKIEMVDEMLAAAEQEFQRDYPDSTDIEDQLSEIEASINGLQATLGQRQDRLDQLRLERRSLVEAIAGAQERQTEIAISLERFEVLRRIYDSDVERLSSLEEGGAALMAGSRRPCPLCGAAPDHQHHTHGLDEVERAQRAVRAEIAKIVLERSDLLKATASLRAEEDGLARRADRMAVDLEAVDGEIAEARPLEAASRSIYEESTRVRDRLRIGMALSRRVDDLKKRKLDLGEFRPTSTPKAEISVGVGGVIAHELAMAVQSVLHAWHFPGYPTVAFDGATHDILINGKSWPSNGKGVRALMNAAFKIGVLIYCRQKQLPHPGILVLDSPLLSYREPLKSRHGALSEDEKTIKASGVKGHFFAYLKEKTEFAQFIVIENDPPPPGVDAYAKVYAFVGDEGEEGRKGFF